MVVTCAGDDMTIEERRGVGRCEWRLVREKVREARMEEVGYMTRELLWDEVSRSHASGHRIVSVKWVDTNKGTEENQEIRCRLLARDFRGADEDRQDPFAATPPWAEEAAHVTCGRQVQ